MFTHQTFDLAQGSHEFRHEGVCFMEAVAFINGESHTSRPSCTDSQLANFMMGINDALDDQDRQLLKPFIPRAIVPSARWATDRPARDQIVIEALCEISVPHLELERGFGLLIEALRHHRPRRSTSEIKAGRAIGLHLPIERVLEIVDAILPSDGLEVDPTFDPLEPPQPEPEPQAPDEVEVPEKPELVPA